ncbi:hypothetical protein [Hoeflea alexandrii]|uniref:hypothetical protein n=1 Tax=Hoeflea alexandrii TaxID=288436 RepID=UPI0022AF02F9|nr:hypothetical protein [Hoeflea alexandrii]MCZ4290987.1 hypothetical protein [Hoeflea alexandrii]
MIDQHCHTSSIRVKRSAAAVFDLMSDGIKQGHWAWGSFQREEVSKGLFVGTSVFDGQQTFVRLNSDVERLTVDYEVGKSEANMQFRNMSRVLPGPVVGLSDEECIVSLITWRLASQDDDSWSQIGTVHEAEMYLIRGLAERGLPNA